MLSIVLLSFSDACSKMMEGSAEVFEDSYPPRAPLSLRPAHSCTSPVENCGDSTTEDGYTDSYSPETATDLSEVYDADLLEGDDTDYLDSSTSLDCSLYLGELSRQRRATLPCRKGAIATVARFSHEVMLGLGQG